MFKQLSTKKSDFLGFERLGRHINWTSAITRREGLVGPLIRVARLVMGTSSLSIVLSVISFSRSARHIHRYSGSKGLALYLKACTVLLMKAVSGGKVEDHAPLGVRVACSRDGFPVIITSAHRKAMRRGSTRLIRLWLTFFGLYRVIEFRARFSVKTIVSPGPLYVDRFSEFIPQFILLGRFKLAVKPWTPILALKSGPLCQAGDSKGPYKGTIQHNLGPGYLPTRCYRQTQMSVLWLQAVQIVNAYPELLQYLDAIQRLTTKKRDWVSDMYLTFIASLCPGKLTFPHLLGKLGVKEEPGKKRVFAMVDYWTQAVLKPLHDGLFAILKTIPEDATFDQEEGVRSAQQEILKSPTPYVASFDLSAATDRLPVRLQAQILDYLLPGLGDPWRGLLVDRSYAVPRKYHSVASQVRYGVGQPMGAYSSWAMLALTHHFLVQFSARKSGHTGWFSSYRVLGDDIIIWDIGVALYYRQVMRDLGVDISFAKSLVSNNRSFEFAKRFYHRGVDCSAVSLKEMSASMTSLEGLLTMVRRFGRQASPALFACLLGFGYRVRGALMAPLRQQSKAMSLALRFLAMPGVSDVSFKHWSQWIGMTGLHRTEVFSCYSSLIDALREDCKVPTRIGNLMRLDGGGYFQFIDHLKFSYQESSIKADPEVISNYSEGLIRPLYKTFKKRLDEVRKEIPQMIGSTPYDFDQAYQAYIDFVPKRSALVTTMPDMIKRSDTDMAVRSVRRWYKVQRKLWSMLNSR